MSATAFPRHRYSIRAAVTWRIVAELLRRHHWHLGLRAFQTHPAGGMADCLTLAYRRVPDDRLGRTLCHLAVDSQHLHVVEPYGRPKTESVSKGSLVGQDYVNAYLTAEDPKLVIDDLDAILGLETPVRLMPMTAPIFSFRLVAAIMERYAFARTRVETRCCWFDSSYDAHVEDWISLFPELAAAASNPNRAAEGWGIAGIAGRLWRIGQRSEGGGIVLDVATGQARVFGHANRAPAFLWEAYVKGGRRFEDAVTWAAEQIDVRQKAS